MKELPKRKPNRLKDYDYSQNGMYFITICAKNRIELFGRISVGANCVRPLLSDLGNIIETEIKFMSNMFDTITIDCYVVMPNHVHMIIIIDNGRTQFAPTISRLIKQWKGCITKQIGFSPWQKSFHDHIIRNYDEYIRIMQYIENNPKNWPEDCFYGG